MTEENKDSKPPKLRLSLEPKELDAGPKPKPEPEAKEAATPEEKPNLRLRRPDAEPETQAPTPPAETPENRPAEAKPVEPPDASAFEPKNPFQGVATDSEPKKSDRSPPELPSKPAPSHDDGPAQKVEEAIGQTHEEKKHKGLLASIVVILGLLIFLGACGFGLYYVLMSPSEDSNATDSAEPAIVPEERKEESGSLLSRPIAKAKAVVAEMQDPESVWTEEKASAPVEKPSQQAVEAKPAEIAEPVPVALAPSVDSPQTSVVSEFLKNAHIGGVRTGDRPKLLLNGQSYDQGDLIDPGTGLRFIGLRDKKLAFQDAQGIVYIKSF